MESYRPLRQSMRYKAEVNLGRRGKHSGFGATEVSITLLIDTPGAQSRAAFHFYFLRYVRSTAWAVHLHAEPEVYEVSLILGTGPKSPLPRHTKLGFVWDRIGGMHNIALVE